jgi:hypothetical protein
MFASALRKLLAIAALSGVAVLLPASGDLAAKPLARVLKETGLSQSDFDYVLAVEKSLYTKGQAGRVESWSNAETGAKGASKLAAKRGDCMYMQHFITLPNGSPRQEFRTVFCRQADGRWLRQPR